MQIIHPKAGDQKIFQLCSHLLGYDPQDCDKCQYFLGIGIEYAIICESCFYSDDPLYSTRTVEKPIFEQYNGKVQQDWYGVGGKPEIIRTSDLEIEESDDIKDFDVERNVILATAKDSLNQDLVILNRDKLYQRMEFIKYQFHQLRMLDSVYQLKLIFEIEPNNIHLFDGLNLEKPLLFEIIVDRGLLILTEKFGSHGVLINFLENTLLFKLNRGSYHVGVSNFPVGFWCFGGKWYIIHGTDWNRIDLTDIETGETLSDRDVSKFDYFHGKLHVKTNGTWVIDDGWVWGPAGVPIYWNIKNWLVNPSEPEDYQRDQYLTIREDWDLSLLWKDEQSVMIQGYGGMEGLAHGLTMYNLERNEIIAWMPGPQDTVEYDLRNNYVIDYTIVSPYRIKIWDFNTGKLIFSSSKYQVIAVSGNIILVKKNSKLFTLKY